MASEFAERIGGSCYPLLEAQRKVLTKQIDAELAEVREVLGGLKNEHDCWCHFDGGTLYELVDGHTQDCQRARALYSKLKVEG